MISEQRRLHYLQSMGIDGYYPRYQLLGAAVSVACEHIFDEEYAFLADSIVMPLEAASESESRVQQNGLHDVTQKHFNESESTNKKQAPEVVSLLAKDLADPKKRRVSLNAKQSSEELNKEKNKLHASNVAEQAVAFNLGVWRVSDDLLIMDTRQPNMALPTEKLLLNIIRALGYDVPQLPEMTQLRWPSIDSASSNDEKSAREMVEAFLIAENNKKSFTQMLLMGNNAAKFVLPKKNQDEPAVGDSDAKSSDTKSSSLKNKAASMFNFNALVSHAFEVNTTEIKANAIVVPSLTVLLQKPKFKAITWQSIQKFRI